MPVTNPEVAPIVATDGLLLVQEPPDVASAKVAVEPIQYTAVEPPIAAGNGFTVNGLMSVQPEGNV